MRVFAICVFTFAAARLESALAQYALPSMGGGQVSQGTAAMKHADIMFSADSGLQVHVDNSVETPRLRPLEAPFQFDPEQPWSILDGKAYNFQYGWNAGGFISLPPGAWIWIEQLSATPGLEAYQRPPGLPAYAPIFGTNDSSVRWRWSGAMTHNVYAVDHPRETLYEATYRVYIGDDETGEPAPDIGSAEVTFQFIATPESLGDFDEDGDADGADFILWQRGESPHAMSDQDRLDWETGFGDQFPDEVDAPHINSVPEPGATSLVSLAALVASTYCIRNRCGQSRRRKTISGGPKVLPIDRLEASSNV